jgi:hypothetical protein
VTGVTTTTYSDTTGVFGTTYFYKVTAVNGNAAPLASESASSNEASATAQRPAPANLKATPVGPNNGAPSIALSWSAVPGVTAYRVYRSTTSNGQTGTALAAGIMATTYTDRTAAFGTTYFYKVTAVFSGVESAKSSEASATALLVAHIRFTAQSGAQTVAGYLNDVGAAYGSRINGLTFGWNRSNTSNMFNRNSANSPDELHDGVANLQAITNSNAWWGIAVPNGTYKVQLLAGDPTSTNSVFRINVGGTRSGTSISGGTLIISGTPTTAKRWFENTLTITVTGGVLYVSNAQGSRNNKINEIDITQVLPGQKPASALTANAAMTVSGSAQISGSSLVVAGAKNDAAASVFSAPQVPTTVLTTSDLAEATRGERFWTGELIIPSDLNSPLVKKFSTRRFR